MKLISKAIQDGAPIPDAYAFCIPGADGGKPVFGKNINPDFTWSDLPEGTESLALICHDPDAPASSEGVNQDGETVAEDRPRQNFYHWLLINIPGDSTGLVEGAFSNGVVKGGKDDLHAAQDTRQGINNYTEWFDGQPGMAGQYLGYDGPAPPWNDAKVHRYHFTLYALEVDDLGLGYWFTAEEMVEAMEDYILAEAHLTGTYTLNPDLR